MDNDTLFPLCDDGCGKRKACSSLRACDFGDPMMCEACATGEADYCRSGQCDDCNWALETGQIEALS